MHYTGDDDIDIAMLRDDYRKFKSVMYDAFPPDYCISTYDSSESSNWEMIIRVMNSKTICFDSDFLSNNFDCPYPMGIDILLWSSIFVTKMLDHNKPTYNKV